MESKTMHGVNNVGHGGQARGQPTYEPGLGCVGMNQIVLRRAQMPHELLQANQIPSRSDIPPDAFKPDMANATASQCPLELKTAC